MAVTLTLSGTYGQMTAFLHGLDSFPRLFTVGQISVNGGPVATGGQAIPATTGGYNLTLAGNIYYSTGQSNVCAGDRRRRRDDDGSLTTPALGQFPPAVGDCLSKPLKPSWARADHFPR